LDDRQRGAGVANGRMRRVEPMKQIPDDGDGHPDGQRLAALPARPEQRRQRFPVDVLQDDPHLLALLDDVDHRHHVEMPDASGNARLVPDGVDHRGVPGERGMDPLDGDGAREAQRAGRDRKVDDRHSARTELRTEHVPAERASLVRRVLGHDGSVPSGLVGARDDACGGGDKIRHEGELQTDRSVGL